METRTSDQIRRHYEIEKELANRLRNSSREERKTLYQLVYDELFARVPDHPMLTRKQDPALRQREVQDQMKLLKPFLNTRQTLLEIGPGDCSLSFELCNHVKRVYAVDVSSTITSNEAAAFELSIDSYRRHSPRSSIASIDFVFSNQLMEHLHPDDALEQLTDIYRVLRPGGVYFCITPHRFMGPDDISKYFDKVATGFHMKEYTNRELFSIFKKVGFSRISSYVGWKGSHYRQIPTLPVRLTEFLLHPLPYSFRKKLSFAPFIRNILYIKMFVAKPQYEKRSANK